VVAVALAVVEHAALEGPRVGGIVEQRLHLGRGQAVELSEELAASFPDQPTELALVIGKKQKRARGGELLSLEQQWDAWREKQTGGHRPPASRAR
jgi:hypothetical protein